MHVTMVIIFLDLNIIVFFRDGYLYCYTMEEKYWLRTVLFLFAIMHKKCNYAQEIQTFQFYVYMVNVLQWAGFAGQKRKQTNKHNQQTHCSL